MTKKHPCFEHILFTSHLLTTLMPDGKYREYHLFTCNLCDRPLIERVILRTPKVRR